MTLRANYSSRLFLGLDHTGITKAYLTVAQHIPFPGAATQPVHRTRSEIKGIRVLQSIHHPRPPTGGSRRHIPPIFTSWATNDLCGHRGCMGIRHS